MTDAEKPRARRWRLGTEHLCGQKKTHGRVKHLPGSGVQWGMELMYSHTGLPVHGTKFTMIRRAEQPGVWSIVGHRLPVDALHNVSRERLIATIPDATAQGIAVFVRIGGEFHRVSVL